MTDLLDRPEPAPLDRPRIDPRFARRWIDARQEGRRRLQGLILVGALVALVVLAVGSLFSPLFHVGRCATCAGGDRRQGRCRRRPWPAWPGSATRSRDDRGARFVDGRPARRRPVAGRGRRYMRRWPDDGDGFGGGAQPAGGGGRPCRRPRGPLGAQGEHGRRSTPPDGCWPMSPPRRPVWPSSAGWRRCPSQAVGCPTRPGPGSIPEPHRPSWPTCPPHRTQPTSRPAPAPRWLPSTRCPRR